MPRMSKKRKHELSFYLNDRGRVTYNELCRKCQHGCKQSFRAVVIDCPRYLFKIPKLFSQAKKVNHTNAAVAHIIRTSSIVLASFFSMETF